MIGELQNNATAGTALSEKGSEPAKFNFIECLLWSLSEDTNHDIQVLLRCI